MKAKLTTRIQKYLLVVTLVFAVTFALIWTALQGYSAAWTGFGDFTRANSDFVRGKTLWDWMQLFIIPIFLSIGVFLLNRSERNNEREIATDRQHEVALQSYLDRMADLILKGELLTTKSEDVRNVARIRTLTLLRGLDTTRKGVVLRFLQEAELISKENTIVKLAGADLHGAKLASTNLPGADMQRADWEFYDGLIEPIDAKHGLDLHGVNLYGANLKDVNLHGADLESANLRNAYLYGADLRNVNLKHADLRNANLRFANLKDAKLQGAFLNNADLKGANMESANLKDAILDDAYLIQANLRHAKLEGARRERTVMPDGVDFTKLNPIQAITYHVMLKHNEDLRVLKSNGEQQEGATMPDDTKQD